MNLRKDGILGLFVPLAGVALPGLPGLEISKFVLSLERIERKFANRDLESIIGRMIEYIGEHSSVEGLFRQLTSFAFRQIDRNRC
ncbi:MAG: hypothetical protein ABGY43_03865 [bacterium]|nr:hypothetical protein [Gammaproteobacteria bacterium]HIL83182.1 hypothetical protein [Pseudomonadales bacterium]